MVAVKFLKNEKGIVLVTTLMLTLLTLTITMVMLYMVLQSTQLSGANKRYKNALDAAVGGVDIVTMDALPYLLSYAVSPNGNTLISRLQIDMSPLNNIATITTIPTDACLQAKLTSKVNVWGTVCNARSSNVNPDDTPDFTFTLKSQVPGNITQTGFNVNAKIVSTTVGSTDMSGRNLEGQSTTGPPPVDIGSPYMYRIEVSSVNNANPVEKAKLSVLYAY